MSVLLLIRIDGFPEQLHKPRLGRHLQDPGCQFICFHGLYFYGS